MKDYINIGPTPFDEDCAQVGNNDYGIKSKIETTAYKNQLNRMFPEVLNSKTLSFSIKTFQHDFGSYKEVVLNYDDDNEEEYNQIALEKVDANIPKNWDEEALKEIKTQTTIVEGIRNDNARE